MSSSIPSTSYAWFNSNYFIECYGYFLVYLKIYRLILYQKRIMDVQAITQLINQLLDKFIERSINQSIDHSINQSINQSIKFRLGLALTGM